MHKNIEAMLDLKQLEALIDEALNKETTATLTKWIEAQRQDKTLQYLGEGQIINLQIESDFQFNKIENTEQLFCNKAETIAPLRLYIAA